MTITNEVKIIVKELEAFKRTFPDFEDPSNLESSCEALHNYRSKDQNIVKGLALATKMADHPNNFDIKKLNEAIEHFTSYLTTQTKFPTESKQTNQINL
jgi:hypothetical protein